MLDIAIVGGGFCGLSLAQKLLRQQRQFALFEARDRFGGRILSSTNPIGDTGFRNDLGPSWIWPDDQNHMAAFVAEHGLHIYPQWSEGKSLYHSERHAPAQAFIDHTTYASARRLVGGSHRLVEALLGQLLDALLHLNHRLLAVIDRDEHILLQFDNAGKRIEIKARRVVLTIPPRLLESSVEFEPALDPRLRQVMRDTATWMAGHAKAVIYYDRPFWREAGYSGSAFASYQGAALAEIFDACTENGELAAVSGFFALPAVLRQHYRADLETLIIEQLFRLFGPEAQNPQAIVIQDWFTEPYTSTATDEIPPRSHPQYGHPWLQLDHWSDKLFFGGTETSAENGGYLEGALVSAERIAKALALSDLSVKS